MASILRMIGSIATAAIAVSGGNVFAACTPPSSISATVPSEQRYAARYNLLVAEDPREQREDMAPAWRALAADAAADPVVSAPLAARIDTRLAAALGQADLIDDALVAARQAFARAEKQGLAGTPAHAEVLTQLSIAETEAGKVSDAIVHAEAAVAEARAAFGPESWQLARAAIFANSAYFAAGRYAEAEPFAKLAEDLTLACLPPDDPRTVGRITSHATVLAMGGRVDDALAANERAAIWALTHGMEHQPAMLRALDGVGFELRNTGRYHEAEGVLRHAVDLAARYNPTQWKLRAGLLGKFADILEIEGHHREAEALWLQASAYDRKVKEVSNPLIGSGELRRAASAAQARGDLPLALARHQDALAIIAKNAQPDHPELARARIEYATTLALAGRAKEARAVADGAITIVRKKMAEDNYLRMTIEMAYAQIVADSGDTLGAYTIAAPVARRMEARLLDAATSRANLVRFAAPFSASFAIAAGLALATGHDEDAFHDIQLANFSNIAVVNAEIATRAAAANPVALKAAVQMQRDVATRQQLDRNRIGAVSGKDTATIARIDAAVQEADVRIAAAAQELDRVYPAYRRIGRPTPVALSLFQARLGVDDVLIAPVTTAGSTVAVAVTREGLFWSNTPVPRYRLKAFVARIGASIDATRTDSRAAFDSDAARQLYRAVLPQKLGAVLRKHRHILYYASGALATVSPALFIERPLRHSTVPAWLIASHSITILPTLDPPPLANRAARGFTGVGAPLLGTGVPKVFGPTAEAVPEGLASAAAALPYLPRAADELRAMATAFPANGRHVLLGADATERAVKALLFDRVGVLAIATHGLSRDAVPGLAEPALLLTPPAVPDAVDDGMLTASEIANLRVRAEWVILSACATAGGSDTDDASYSGLSQAFFEAGAHALLVSHWAVRDDAAQRLTVATVRATARGTDRATALQRAMLKLMRDRSLPGSANPAIWAPFVLVQ